MRASRGFTLIEIMIVVALIAILAALVIPSFTGESNRAKAESEISAVFAELRTKEEAYKVEHGSFLSTGADDTDLLPAGTLGTTKRAWNTSVAALTELRFAPPEPGALCGYVVIAGVGGDNTGIGALATGFGMPDPPVSNWYYIVARCNLDGNSARDTIAFTSSTNSAIQTRDPGH